MVQLHSYACKLYSFSRIIYWRYCLFPIVYSCLTHKLIDHISMGSLLGFLFCFIDLCLILHQCHTILISLVLQYSLKSGRVISPAFYSFLKISWAILGSFVIHRNFRFICSSSLKNATGYFDRDCIKSVDCFG